MMTVGSSPRVRGAVVCRGLCGDRLGIIPARAGSRVATYRRSIVLWDHPRACGEQYNVLLTNDSHTGSSPRVRGAGTYAPSLC